MSGFTIKLDGFDDVVKKLDVKKLQTDITAVLEAYGRNVVRDAKNNLSLNGTVDLGFLSNSIGSETLAPMSVHVFAHKNYAAYIEFGTGPFAARYVPSLEPEWQAFARQFYINGKGLTPAQPFFYPAFEKNRKQLLDDLGDLITDPKK